MTNQELFEQAVAGNWIAETFTRPKVDGGVGKFYLQGTSKGYTTFGDTVSDGDVVFYAAFDDDCNREAGFGKYNSADQSITPIESNATLANGQYIDGDVQPIAFPKGGTITGTFNAVAFNAIWNHIWDKNNPHEVSAEQVEQDNDNNLGDNVQDALDNLSGIIAEWDEAIKATCQNYVSELPPPSPQKGDMWTDVGVSGEQYVWEGQFWVSVTGGGLGIDLDDPESLPSNIVRDEVDGDLDLYDKPLNRVISSYDGKGKWVEAVAGGGGGSDYVNANESEYSIKVGTLTAEPYSVSVGMKGPFGGYIATESVGVGMDSKAGNSAVAVGLGTEARTNAVAVGRGAQAWDNAMAIGTTTWAMEDHSVAIGHSANTEEPNQVMFGATPDHKYGKPLNLKTYGTMQATDYLDADGNSIIGGGGDPYWAKVDEKTTALGDAASAVEEGVAVGSGASCTGRGPSVAIGRLASSKEEGVAIGRGARAEISGIALGPDCEAPRATFAISDFVNKVDFSGATVQAQDYLDADGNPATVSPSSIVEAFTTLQTAVADEDTLEGVKTALTNALGGLIEKFEGMKNV